VLSDGELIACDTPKRLLENGRATIQVWRKQDARAETIDNYAERLPELLGRYGLDPSVSRIEVEHTPLDQVLLALIEARKNGSGAPHA
jgi:hypothetical protein